MVTRSTRMMTMTKMMMTVMILTKRNTGTSMPAQETSLGEHTATATSTVKPRRDIRAGANQATLEAVATMTNMVQVARLLVVMEAAHMVENQEPRAETMMSMARAARLVVTVMEAIPMDASQVTREAAEMMTNTVLVARPAVVLMEVAHTDASQRTLPAAKLGMNTAVVANPVVMEEERAVMPAATPMVRKPAAATDATQLVTILTEVVAELVDIVPTTRTRTRAMAALLEVGMVEAIVSRCLVGSGMIIMMMRMRDGDAVAMVTKSTEDRA